MIMSATDIALLEAMEEEDEFDIINAVFDDPLDPLNITDQDLDSIGDVDESEGDLDGI